MQLNGLNGLTNGWPKNVWLSLKVHISIWWFYICVYDIQTANIPKHHSNENINTSVCINENKNNNIF